MQAVWNMGFSKVNGRKKAAHQRKLYIEKVTCRCIVRTKTMWNTWHMEYGILALWIICHIENGNLERQCLSTIAIAVSAQYRAEFWECLPHQVCLLYMSRVSYIWVMSPIYNHNSCCLKMFASSTVRPKERLLENWHLLGEISHQREISISKNIQLTNH